MTALIIIAWTAAALIVLTLALSLYFFYITCVSGRLNVKPENVLEVRKKQMPEFAQDFEDGYKYLDTLKIEKLTMTSRDGLKLRADFIDCPERKGIFLLMHGYRSTPYADFVTVLSFYRSLGYALLLPSERSLAESEGRYMTYGAKERYDCIDWLNKIRRDFGADTPVFADGISMGCTVVLAAAGLGMPDNVRGIIADCGFTSPGEIITHVMKLWLHLPKFPFYYLVGLWCRLFAHFSFNEFSTVDAMKKNRIPVFFAHGKADNFVPHEMTLRNYEACAAEKELVLVEGAGHGQSYLCDRPGTEEKLRSFIAKHG